MSPKQESLAQRIEGWLADDYATSPDDDLRALAAEVAEVEGQAVRDGAAIRELHEETGRLYQRRDKAISRALRAEARVEKLEEALRDSEERCERNHVHFSRLCSTCKRKISQREKRRSEALRNQEGGGECGHYVSHRNGEVLCAKPAGHVGPCDGDPQPEVAEAPGDVELPPGKLSMSVDTYAGDCPARDKDIGSGQGESDPGSTKEVPDVQAGPGASDPCPTCGDLRYTKRTVVGGVALDPCPDCSDKGGER